MKIYIKNMVCDRCKMVVRSELEKIGIFPVSVGLGEVELLENLKENQKQELEMKFQSFGFELLEDKTTILIEKIKSLIIDLVHHQNNTLKTNLSN